MIFYVFAQSTFINMAMVFMASSLQFETCVNTGAIVALTPSSSLNKFVSVLS